MFGGPLLLLGGRGPVELTGRDTGTDPLLEWVGLEAMAGLGFEPTEPGGLAGDPPLLLWGARDPGAPSPEGGRAPRALPGPTLSVIIYIETLPPETRKTDFTNPFLTVLNFCAGDGNADEVSVRVARFHGKGSGGSCRPHLD